MKKKRNKARIDNGFISSNGVCFGNDIAMRYTKAHESVYFDIARALLAVILSFATMTMFSAFIVQNTDYAALFFCCTIPVILLCVIRSKNQGIKAIGAVFLTIYIIFFIFNYQDIYNGFLSTAALYLEHAKQPSGILGSSLSGISKALYPELASFFLDFLASIVSVIITFACVFRIDFPMLFVATFPLFELGMYWGWQAPTLSVTILVGGWILLISLHSINQRTNRAGRRNTFAVHEKKQTYYLTNEKEKSKAFFTLSGFVALLCAALFIVIIALSNLFGHERSERVDSYRKKINNFVNNFTLEDLGGLFADYDGGFDFFGTKSVGGTNGGRLGDTDGISFNGTTALEVTTKPLNETMYLRGYVAGKYKDNKWDPIEYEDEEFAKEFDDFGISPQDVSYFEITDLTNFLAANGEADYTVDEEIDVNVKGASRKFVYAPYGSYYTNNRQKNDFKMRPYFDSYVKLGTKEYTIGYKKPNSYNYNVTRNNIADKNVFYEVNSTIPANSLKKYDKFVKDNYRDVTDSPGLQAAYKEIDQQYLHGDRTFSNVIYAINKYFRDNYKYSLEPGKTPDDRDFVDYFLSEQKKGYCSYFASAGVQLMRKFGFGARYVEGYIVLPGMSKTSDETITVEVPDKCAHAWTEVYIEDFGWVCTEFTPGYVNDNPNMDPNEKNPNESKPDESSSLPDSSSEPDSSAEVSSSLPDSTISVADQSSSSNSTADPSSSSQAPDQSSSSPDDSSAASTVTPGNNSGGGTNSNVSGVPMPVESGDDTSSGAAVGRLSGTSMMLFIILFIFFFIGVIVLRRILSIKTMQTNCLDGENKERVQNIIRYTVKYLELLGIDAGDNITDMQLCAKLNEQLQGMDIDISEKLQFMFETAERAYMSNKPLSDDSAQQTYDYMQDIANNTVKPKLDIFKRFSSMFVSCLY